MGKAVTARIVSILVLVMAGAGLFACAPDAERAQPDAPVGEAAAAVIGLVEAFNEHDPDAMRAFWREDVSWVEISGEGASVITSSADQLYDELVLYFERFPSVRSSLENIAVNGSYVSAVERAVWEEGGERKSQSSFVVYEIEDGKVKRFWYFPPQT